MGFVHRILSPKYILSDCFNHLFYVDMCYSGTLASFFGHRLCNKLKFPSSVKPLALLICHVNCHLILCIQYGLSVNTLFDVLERTINVDNVYIGISCVFLKCDLQLST